MIKTPFYDWSRAFIDKLDLSGQQKILDVGCREGWLSYELALRYPQNQFVGIDHSEENILKTQQHRLTNLSFEKESVLALPCTDMFDSVVSFNHLLWVKNKYSALQHIYNGLKAGGKAYLQLFATHGHLRNDRFLYQCANYAEWQNYFTAFTPDYYEISLAQISALLQDIGFIIHRLEFVKYPSILEHPDELHQFLKTWATHKNRIPLRKQDYYLKQCTDAYLNFHHYEKNNAFTYHEYLLEVVCEKPAVPLTEEAKCFQLTQLKLTPREIFVLKHVLMGKTAKEIARLDDFSSKAVEFHIANIKTKFHCRSRSEIYQMAVENGLLYLITQADYAT
ncbi:MAG: methyltransferase domain-containing protein [Legionellales bacterium]|nr:methyltransferase domain-containing protein [Legionellales bacterium]